MNDRQTAKRIESTAGMDQKRTHAEQARINGAKSRGPISPAGKAISRWNSLKHGQYAKLAAVVAMENDAFFEKLLAAYMDLVSPRNPVEQRLARELATIDWRMARDVTIQTRLLEQQANDLPDATIEHCDVADIVAKAADALNARSKAHMFYSSSESRHMANRKRVLDALKTMRQLGISQKRTDDPLSGIDPEGNEPTEEAL